MASSAIEQLVKGELEHYPGVKLELKDGRRHDRAVFFFGGKSRFLTLPKTPSDWRANENIKRDLKKTLGELGVKRAADYIARGSGSRGGAGRRTKTADAAFGLNKNGLVFTIGVRSQVRKKFGKASGRWQFELRASPDLRAPPLLVLKKATLPAGMERKAGVVAGSDFGGAWKFQVSRPQLPKMLQSIDRVSSIDVKLLKDEGDALVFSLPAGILPTSFQPHADELPAPLPSEAWAEPIQEPQEAPQEAVEPAQATEVAQARTEPQVGLQDRPIVLQFPKQTVSVEQAIAVLNRRKQQLGNGLRFTIEEGGYISAVHRIGK